MGRVGRGKEFNYTYGSVIDWLIDFPPNEMVANAGHSIETFDKHYSRPMIPRQKRAFKNHPRSALLSKEEVQLL